MKKKIDDEKVAQKLIEMKLSGRNHVRAGEIARIFGVDSIMALGAMERVKRRVQRT